MKKTLFVGLMFLCPLLVSAQSVQDRYISSLNQLIALLEQQLVMLENELANLPATTSIQTAQNVSPTSQQATQEPVTFGSTNPAPTCTFMASTTDSASTIGQVSWTSTNATRGTLIYHNRLGWFTIATLTPVDSGYRDGLEFDNAPNLQAQFTGPGGTTNCLPQ